VAVYQGARQRTIALPRAPRLDIGIGVGVSTPAVPRRRRRAAVRAHRGPSRLSLLLAAIVVAFAGAFFSLSQDIRVSATSYEADHLATQARQLEDQAQDLRNDLNRLGKAPAIKTLAVQAGLGQLPEPLVVPAR
jgi:cell division protein FtsL